MPFPGGEIALVKGASSADSLQAGFFVANAAFFHSHSFPLLSFPFFGERVFLFPLFFSHSCVENRPFSPYPSV